MNKTYDKPATENISRTVCRGLEPDTKSNHTAYPFADIKLVGRLVARIGFEPSVDGVSVVRKIDTCRDFLRVADLQ